MHATYAKEIDTERQELQIDTVVIFLRTISTITLYLTIWFCSMRRCTEGARHTSTRYVLFKWMIVRHEHMKPVRKL